MTKSFIDITIQEPTEPARLRNYLNTFRGITANVIGRKIRIYYTPGQVSEKWILKLVGCFNRQKTGKKPKVLKVDIPVFNTENTRNQKPTI